MPKPRTIQEQETDARAALVHTLATFQTVAGPIEAWLTARRATLADGILRDGADIERTRGKADFMMEFKTLLAQSAPEHVQGETEDE